MMPPSWGGGSRRLQEAVAPPWPMGCLDAVSCSVLTVQGGQHSAGIAFLRLPLATSHRGLPIIQQALCPLFCSSVWGKVNTERQLAFRAQGPSEVLGGKMAVGEPL